MKTAKRILSIVLAAVMILSLQARVFAASSNFTDMPSDYSAAALNAAVANGLLNGDGNKIMPDSPLTRAQMAAIIVRAFGSEKAANLSGYSDVSASAWYYSELSRAVQMKVLQGEGSSMRPNDPITRQEAFAIIARALKLDEGSSSDLAAFSDKGSVSSWAVGSTAAMVKAGFIHGANGYLNPLDNISRKDFAVMMNNIVKNYVRTPGTVTTLSDGSALVSTANVTLKGLTVKGDLIIGDGVGEGNVTLDNVKVTGRMIVRGGGVNSIIVRGASSVGTIIVSKVDGNVRVAVEGGAEVEVIHINDGRDDVIIEGSVGTVEVSAGEVPVSMKGATVSELKIRADHADVTIDKDSNVASVTASGAQASLSVAGTVGTITASQGAVGAKIEVAKGATVTTVNADASGAEIKGEGSVKNANVTGNNVTVDTKGTQVKVGEGATGVKAGGKEVKPGETTTTPGTTTPGGGGGGGGYVPPSPAAVTAKVRPDGPAEGTANFDYAAAYAAAGVTVTDGTNQNSNTVTINVTPANKTAIDDKIKHEVSGNTYAFVGVQFNKPDNAVTASVTIDGGSQSNVDLTTDGDSVYGGQYIEYFAVYNDAGNALANKTWTVVIVWKDETDAALSTTAYSVRRVDLTLDSTIAAVTAIPGTDLDALGWTGMPVPPAMTLQYVVDPIAKKVNAAGSLAYAAGFTGFSGNTAEQSGYYPAFRIAIPDNIAAVVNGSTGTVMTITGNTTNNFTKDNLIEGAAGGYYIDVIMHRAASDADFTMTFDWDGSGLAYRPITYTFDLSAVDCLITESDITGTPTGNVGDTEIPLTKAYLAEYLNAMFTFSGTGTIAWDDANDKLTVTGYKVDHDKDSETDTSASAWTIWTGRIMDGFSLDLSNVTSFVLASDSWLHVQSAATLTLPDDAKITLGDAAVITKDGTSSDTAWGYKSNGNPKYFDVLKGSLPAYSYEEGVTGYPALVNLVDSLSAETEAFFNAFYNKAPSNETVTIDDSNKADYFVEIGIYLGADNPATATIGNTEYSSNDTYPISVGNNRFIEHSIWGIEDGKFYVALPYLCVETMPGTEITILVGGQRFDVTTYAAAAANLVIDSVDALGTQAGYANNAAFDDSTVTHTTAHGKHYVGVKLSDGTAVLDADALIFRKNTEDNSVGITKPESSGHTYAVYGKYNSGNPYDAASTSAKSYRLAIPGKGVIDITFEFNFQVAV